MAGRIEEDLYFSGAVRFADATIQNGGILNAQVGSGAAIVATKLEHQHAIYYMQVDGADVAAAIAPIHIVSGAAATVIRFEVVCLDAPSGGDKTFTVDLLKSNAGTPAPATLLTTPRTYPNDTADATVLAGSIASPTLADGDTLVIQVAVSGSTGTQGQGVVAVITLREDAA